MKRGMFSKLNLGMIDLAVAMEFCLLRKITKIVDIAWHGKPKPIPTCYSQSQELVSNWLKIDFFEVEFNGIQKQAVTKRAILEQKLSIGCFLC